MATTIQFKRGSSQRWAEINPILAEGEPGYDTTKGKVKIGKVKIGNGVDTWEDLLFIGDDKVVNRPTKYQFPNIGLVDVIYKAAEEKMLYQWNSSENVYEVLGPESGELDVDIISGGTATDLLQ